MNCHQHSWSLLDFVIRKIFLIQKRNRMWNCFNKKGYTPMSYHFGWWFKTSIGTESSEKCIASRTCSTARNRIYCDIAEKAQVLASPNSGTSKTGWNRPQQLASVLALMLALLCHLSQTCSVALFYFVLFREMTNALNALKYELELADMKKINSIQAQNADKIGDFEPLEETGSKTLQPSIETTMFFL